VGRNRFQLPLYVDVKEPAAEVKLLPLKAERVSKIETRDLIDFIRRSSFCIAAGNVNQQFAMDVMMLNIGKTGFTASAFDGYSIARIFIPRPETVELGNLLLPQDTLGVLQKLMMGKDAVADIIYGDKLPNGEYREVFFRTEDSMIGVRLGQGTFPNIDKQLTSHKAEFCIAVVREELKNAVRRAASFVSDDIQKRYVDLSVEGQALTLEAKDGVASDIDDQMDVTTTTGTIAKTKITVSIDYLANILSGLHEETLQMGFNSDPRKALTVLDGNDSQTQSQYALMPVIHNAAG
jgi:DNA polymerase III sliding clamp (beta) subunit (PCNA family)